MDAMRLRFLAMGSIFIMLGVGLLASRGFSTAVAALPLIGALFLVLGILWNKVFGRRKRGGESAGDSPQQGQAGAVAEAVKGGFP